MKQTATRLVATALVVAAASLTPSAGHAISVTPAPTLSLPASAAPSVLPPTGGRFPIPTFAGVELWVDPVHGSDAHAGHTRATALASVAEAWRRIPVSVRLTTGYRINLVRGTYPTTSLPNYWEHRWGTAAAPVILRAADGWHSARLLGDINAYDVRHFYVLGVDVASGGDAVHFERCSFVVLRGMALSGEAARGGSGAHETVKVNQSDHVYIEDSDIHGADDNAVDFVAVAYGHILGNHLHGAQDWCAYTKGGSAWITVMANEIDHCGTGGFTAGQGTGFEFMVSPYLHYEAYGIRVLGNLVHDTEGAGLGVNGGYNVLMAHNTLYRVGSRSHAVEFVQGGRSCDAASAGASTTPCAARRAMGGWGTTDAGGQWIPNRHVYFLNNIVANPAGFASQWSHFDVHPPAIAPAASGVPSPARADSDLVIAGNVFLNGDGNLDLGFYAGACGATHAGCSPAFVRAHNRWGASQRVFVDPGHGDFRLLAGSVPATASIAAIRPFVWTDAPARPRIPTGAWSGPRRPAMTRPGTWLT